MTGRYLRFFTAGTVLGLLVVFAVGGWAMSCGGGAATSQDSCSSMASSDACPMMGGATQAPATTDWYSGTLSAINSAGGYLELKSNRKTTRFLFDDKTGFASGLSARQLRKGDQVTIGALARPGNKLWAKSLRRGSQQSALLALRGLQSDHCIQATRGALEGLTGVDQAVVTLTEAKVFYDPKGTNQASLRKAIESAGYEVTSSRMVEETHDHTPTSHTSHQH